ncbi:restriction endonuclease subunit S [Empedobacter brevis]
MGKLQPKLRFPEFREEWEETILSNIAKIQMGQSPDSNSYNNNNLGFGLIQGNADLIDRKVQLRQHTSKPTKLTNINDIIFTVRAPVGYVALCEDIYCIGRGVASITANYSIGFLFQYFIKVEERWNTLAQGSTFTAINSKELNNFKLNIPTLQEQTKIADFLGAVDKQLDILNQKKEKLNTYKKGVMQQLFSQQIRFKDDNGNDFPDWEEKTLGEVISFRNGKGHEKVIDLNGDFVVVNSKYISTDGFVSKYTNELISPLFKNDIVMVMSDLPNGKALGKCLLIDRDNFYTLNQRICALTPNHLHNNPIFLKFIINRNSYFLKFDDGVNQTNLKKNEVLNCPLTIPTIEEQTKIAEFLSAIDKQIEAVENQITQTETYKKGLLQQMFV